MRNYLKNLMRMQQNLMFSWDFLTFSWYHQNITKAGDRSNGRPIYWWRCSLTLENSYFHLCENAWLGSLHLHPTKEIASQYREKLLLWNFAWKAQQCTRAVERWWMSRLITALGSHDDLCMVPQAEMQRTDSAQTRHSVLQWGHTHDFIN